MQCARCHREFAETDLKPPPLWLRVVTFPLLFASPALLHDAFSRYCSRCRRSVNAAFFFCVAIVMIMLLAFAMSYFIPEEIRHMKVNEAL